LPLLERVVTLRLPEISSVQVIPEGAGPVKVGADLVWSFSVGLWARRGEVSGSRLGRSPTA
jgi:hypothetical protein